MSSSMPKFTIYLNQLALTAAIALHHVRAPISALKLRHRKAATGIENIFLSSKAHLDGSKPVRRGGGPLVFTASLLILPISPCSGFWSGHGEDISIGLLMLEGICLLFLIMIEHFRYLANQTYLPVKLWECQVCMM